jgi:cytochrome c556
MWAAELAAAGAEVQKFASAKTFNEDAIIELTGKVSDACQHCHDKYRNTPKEPDDRCMVTATTAAAK